MTIELALLGYFVDSPAHGYDIYQQICNPAGLWQVWRIKQSQLYALLSRFEEQGWLAASYKPQPGRPVRKMLALTDTGRKIYLNWLQSPVDHGRDMRIEFLAKLFFALQTPDLDVDRLIDTQREICRSWQQDMPRSAEPPFVSSSSSDPFSNVVLAFRRTQIDAFVAFLDLCESMRQVRDAQ